MSTRKIENEGKIAEEQLKPVTSALEGMNLKYEVQGESVFVEYEDSKSTVFVYPNLRLIRVAKFFDATDEQDYPLLKQLNEMNRNFPFGKFTYDDVKKTVALEIVHIYKKGEFITKETFKELIRIVDETAQPPRV